MVRGPLSGGPHFIFSAALRAADKVESLRGEMARRAAGGVVPDDGIMDLTDAELDEFADRWARAFGTRPPRRQARHLAREEAALYEAMKPPPPDDDRLQ